MIIQINLVAKWQFKDYPYYKITTCKKVVNTKTGKIINFTKSGGSVGYFIAGNFYKKSDINSYIELIPKTKYPF